jgi:hypothetical protein
MYVKVITVQIAVKTLNTKNTVSIGGTGGMVQNTKLSTATTNAKKAANITKILINAILR